MKTLTLALILTCACIYLHAQVIITTIAGTGLQGYNGDNGYAINAEFYNPEGVCLDNLGNLYIADPGNNRIRKIDLSTGVITTVAGNGTAGYVGDNSLATNAELNAPVAIFVEKSGNLLIADGFNFVIRRLNISTGIITTVAGNGTQGYSGDVFAATDATFNAPDGICKDKYENIYIADMFNNRIRKVDAATGIITTIAGCGTAAYTGDGGILR